MSVAKEKLWAHLVSAHATILDPTTPSVDLVRAHIAEHKGPGTIRNHPKASRAYTLAKMGEVLIEADDSARPVTTREAKLADAAEVHLRTHANFPPAGSRRWADMQAKVPRAVRRSCDCDRCITFRAALNNLTISEQWEKDRTP